MLVRRLVAWITPQRLVELAFRFRPNSEYLIYRDQRLTRRQVFARVQSLAAGLQALGIRKGDRVATLLPACPEAVYAAYLPSVLGTISVPLNPLLGEYELRHVLADCGVSIILVNENWFGQKHAAVMTRLQPDLPDLRHVLVCDGRGDGQACLSLGDLATRATPLRRPRLSAYDPVLISYTSGTTGKPKGAVHTHSGYWGVLAGSVGTRLNLDHLRCLLLPFAPYHYAGLLGVVSALLAGGKVILQDRFDPQTLLELIPKEGVTQIGASPTMLRWMLETPGQETVDLSSVRRITFGTEPIPSDLAEALHERLGCILENMYGTTESMLISWTGLDDPWQRAATTVGRPVPGAEVRIVDAERRPVPAGGTGEIAVRTSQMMSGYHGDPELTARVLDANGWFYTGDLGTMGDDGYLRLAGRRKDLILRGGENIYPAEIEQYLERHPLIRRAGVVGVPGPVGGHEVWAYLERKPGAKLSAVDVLNYCRGQIAAYKIPSEVRFVERLPVTATNKVQGYRLRELAAGEA